MDIKNIIKRYEPEIKHFRKILFPLMHFNIITGFNIYENRAKPKSNFVVDYLHSELDEDKEHRQLLEDKIRRHFESISLQKLEFEKIDRYTSYKLKRGWEAAKYFNIVGEELKGETLETVRMNNESIIGVALQNELEILVNSRKDLSHILEIFRKYFNYYMIDELTGKYIKSGKGNRLRNQVRVIDSWEVPLILVKSSESELIQSYSQISEIQITKNQYFIDILVGNKEKTFSMFLDKTGLEYDTENIFANNVFVNWINKGLYSQRYRQFLKEFNAAQKQI